jgi:hypothetical protein
MSFETLKLFVLKIVLPFLVVLFLSLCLFLGGLRLGAQLQMEQDQPFLTECMSELTTCTKDFTVTVVDGGTP